MVASAVGLGVEGCKTGDAQGSVPLVRSVPLMLRMSCMVW